MRRISQILVTLSLCLSVGLHWGVVQSIAWTGMLVNYSRSASFAEAMEKTFDGQHPCSLCKIVQKGQQAEKDAQSNTVLKQLDPGVPFEALVFYFPAAIAAPWGVDCRTLARFELPAIPPPRTA